MYSRMESRSSWAAGRDRRLNLSGMQLSSESGHHLFVTDPLLPGSCLCLGNAQFLKESDLGFQPFVVVDRHDHEVPLSIRGEVNRLIFLVAYGCNLTSPM